MVKQEGATSESGRGGLAFFSSNEAHTEKLQGEETLESLLIGEEAKRELLLLVEHVDAQQVVPETLSLEPAIVLGNGTAGDGGT
jgi:hypothetical protein